MDWASCYSYSLLKPIKAPPRKGWSPARSRVFSGRLFTPLRRSITVMDSCHWDCRVQADITEVYVARLGSCFRRPWSSKKATLGVGRVGGVGVQRRPCDVVPRVRVKGWLRSSELHGPRSSTDSRPLHVGIERSTCCLGSQIICGLDG